MIQRITIRFMLLVMVLSAGSCKKWLDLQPQDGITGAEFWKTKEQVQAAVTGCYASLLGGSRPIAELLFLWGELRADMVTPTTSTSSEEIDIINVNILPTNSICNWRPLYQTINYCNSVIDFAPGVLEKDPTFTQAALKEYLAEAKTIRALMYFYLARTFGDVPLKLTSTSSDQEIIQIAKSTQQEVLTQVLKDLSEAEPDALVTYGNVPADKGRVTKYTINAMQADVYLWMDKYEESITACDKIINSNKFGLIDGTSPNAWFNTLYVNGNSNESIFELQFDQQKLNPFYTIMTTARRRLQVSSIVMDEMYGVDFIVPENKDIRGDGASVRSTDNTIWKFIGLNSSNSRPQEQSYAHWPLYRYADIFMMKAEALNQQGHGSDALSLLYTIRTRAHALALTDDAPDANDKTAVADFISKERAREFAFEGKRWFDMLRNAKRNNYERLDLLLNMISGTVPPDRQQSAIVKFRDKNCHYLPIYYYELQTDKLLVQNPFYK